MAKELPYLASYKNVGLLFEKIASAKIPEAFVQKYMYDTLGLKSVGDRQLISLLKSMGFIDQSGRPTQDYAKLKNNMLAGQAIADGVKKAYAALFDANEKAHTLPLPELKGLVAQVAGSDTDTTNKIAGTLNALFKVSDFSKSTVGNKVDTITSDDEDSEEDDSSEERNTTPKPKFKSRINPEFHYNIQIHLPANATEETYLNIFNALRKSFQ